jgi:hypothetical protein
MLSSPRLAAGEAMGGTDRLRWLWQRASMMSAGEVAHRLGQAARRRARRLRSRVGLGATAIPVVDPAAHPFLRGPEAWLPSPPLLPAPGEAERLLAGEIPVFGRWVAWRDEPGFWHTDPVLGATWPRQPTERIRYRPGNPVGDVRLVWEPNRLQHLLPLARIAAEDAGARPRAAALLEAQLRSWWEANPPGIGVNHASAMEQALRILAVSYAFDAARPHLSADTARLVGMLVLSHAREVEEGLSLHSSAGNHTVAEAVGLLHAALLFPESSRSPGWERTARRLLAVEGPRQVNPDGGGLEQATWYLLFVADLLALAGTALRHRGAEPVPGVEEASDRGRRFLLALGGSPAELPAIGDGDGGHALSPRLALSWAGPGVPPVVQRFPVTGLTVARPGAGERLLFLHGPLGMPPACGHGHAHALSVLLQHRGRDLLVDPGTYLYGGPPGLRAYFRSTAAHNTVRVGGADQARQVGPFLWRGGWRCEVVREWTEGAALHVLARHDAWRDQGVTHWRGVAYRPGAFLLVWDRLEGPPGPEVEIHWHLGCPARLQGGDAILEPAGARPVRMALPEGEVAMVAGADAPPLGWRSREYGQREPVPTLCVRPRARDGAVTVVWLGDGPLPAPELERWIEPFRAAAATPR